MINRKFWINFHLFLASLFLPFLLLMPLTGSLYLLRFPGKQTQVPAFTVTQEELGPIPTGEEERETFFREVFKRHGVDFDFEYIRKSGQNYIFRPSTRLHYSASEQGGALSFTRLEPDLLKRLVELHKGHGPRAMRVIEIAFGISLILVTLSGVWLAFTTTTYRRIMFSAFAVGVGAIAIAIL